MRLRISGSSTKTHLNLHSRNIHSRISMPFQRRLGHSCLEPTQEAVSVKLSFERNTQNEDLENKDAFIELDPGPATAASGRFWGVASHAGRHPARSCDGTTACQRTVMQLRNSIGAAILCRCSIPSPVPLIWIDP